MDDIEDVEVSEDVWAIPTNGERIKIKTTAAMHNINKSKSKEL